MLWGGSLGALEVRSEGGETRLSGRFPYGAQTELAPGRHEIIAPRAFASRLEAGEDVHLLAGHDYGRPLASRSAGTLTLTDTEAALVLEARIDPGTSWARDFLAAHAAGLIRGLSPGFRVPPGGERVESRGSDLVRTITRAALYELSTVTVPAYPQAQLQARSWRPGPPVASGQALARILGRWRA